MAKTFNNLGDLFKNTAARKQRAAENRNSKSQGNFEKPREVYLNFCEQLGQYYSDKGFNYLKSGPALKKISQDKEWTLNIWFWSDYNNVAGEYIRLSFENDVLSKTLKKWEKSQPIFSNAPHGYVNHVNTAKCVDPDANSSLLWNLAQKDDRAVAFDEVTTLINDAVIPNFERFHNPKDLLPEFSDGKEWTSVVTPMKFLLCFGTKEMAIEGGKQFLKSRPFLIDTYRTELEILDKTPPYPSFVHGNFGMELARFTKEYKMGDLSV